LRRLTENEDGTVTSDWFVNNPISNYVINVNVGNYAHERETYFGEAGPLDIDVYVLKENKKYLKRQLLEIRRMLKAFEYWFGPYPFYEDGYKLVEVPYLGMEHQSSITYGNGYVNGYKGTDLSNSGWGLLFDFIIVHESGHEWFANNITYKDVADMWIHESFTNYSESLFLDYHYGKKASSDYCQGTRSRIQNDKPIIGIYGVNKRGSGDMYYKGGNMIHTLRQIINNDESFRQLLRGLNDAFYHQTVTSNQIEAYISRHMGQDLSAFFDQYLRDTRIPKLVLEKEDGYWKYRWTEVNERFNMPVKVHFKDQSHWIHPSTDWRKEYFASDEFSIDEDFYIEVSINK